MRAHDDLLRGRRGTPPAPGAIQDAALGQGVWRTGAVDAVGASVSTSLLGAGCVVAAGAVVDGSVVGAGATVEAGATVSGSVLLPGARVAARATVERSIVGPGATVGQRCTLREVSVVGADVVVPAGTKLEGARVPEGA